MIAISTAFKNALIAFDINGECKTIEMDSSAKHSEATLAALDKALDEEGVSIKDNDCYAVVIGPGSFTGLRIGLSLVKGLCSGRAAKVVPISSTELIAYSYAKHNKINEDFCVVINALSGLYFVCEFDSTGKAIGTERMIEEGQLEALPHKICLKEENLPFEQINISAEDLLEMSLKLEEEGKFSDFRSLSPVYLRRSQAEDAYEAKKVKKS